MTGPNVSVFEGAHSVNPDPRPVPGISPTDGDIDLPPAGWGGEERPELCCAPMTEHGRRATCQDRCRLPSVLRGNRMAQEIDAAMQRVKTTGPEAMVDCVRP